MITGLISFDGVRPDDCRIINSLSDFILEKTKKTDKDTIIGKRTGIIGGNDKRISLIKKILGNPLLIIKSISWTLLLNENNDVISKSIKIEFFSS